MIQKYKSGLMTLQLLSLLGCSQWNRSQVTFPVEKELTLTPIQKLEQQKLDSTVYIKGQVEEKVPLLDQGAYALSDSTGTIWVKSPHHLPQPGDLVLLKGQIQYKSIPVGEQELGERYVGEIEQLGKQTNK
ncbi:MAG: hypothetical protein WA865_01525 [Spirulinaceae cyanobacterium]